MRGVVQSIWRYPVKGFTPEPLDAVALTSGEHVPFDRLYAVEDGPSGFDADAPGHISKQKFTVLAKIPRVAAIRTRFDDGGVLTARMAGQPDFAGDLSTDAGRGAFAAWLTEALAQDITGPLRVLPAPNRHRFMDDPAGFVSVINLESVRALAAAMGRTVDPRRFRANFYVDGWPAWAELDLGDGRGLTLGGTQLVAAKAIRRCVATHVDPETAERDMEVVTALFENFGHMNCGTYFSVTRSGVARPGDAATSQP
ncbi:MAG TPA: MOSC N-terminal beta barrel domain-containing protein [Caulobacteraceae bacterium]